VVTKQAFALWSVDPPPKGFVHADLTQQVAGEVHAIDVLENFTGEARVAGYTVLHGRGQVPKGVALLDTAEGQRAMVTCEDDALVAVMQESELVGRPVRVEANRLLAIL
jgi:hypothetical protein